MRIAVYHPWTYLRGGIERVLSELLDRSRHDWTLYTHHFAPDTTFPALRDHDVVELAPPVSVTRQLVPIAGAAWRIGRTQLPTSDHRALLVSCDGLGDLVLARSRLPAACYCHTPLKILHDPVARAGVRVRAPLQHALLTLLGPGFNAVDRRLWRRYRHVLANSEVTAGRIRAAGLQPSGPLEVLHPGVDVARFGGGATTAREPFLLVAGRIMWQKRIELAIDALAIARRDGFEGELVIAGTVDAKSEPYLADLRARAAGLPVRFETDPDDTRIAHLYASATALVFTAPNEDFGIVPLEAMAAGTPVLAIDAGGVRETVVDGETGWLRPNDPASFAAVYLDVISAGPRLDGMRDAARARAGTFSWDAFVTRVDDVMEAVASGE